MHTTVIESRTLTEQLTCVQRGTMTPPEMRAWFPKAYGEVVEFLRTHHAAPIGPPFARYHRLADGRFEVEAGFPVAAAAVESDGGPQMSKLPGGLVAVTVHVGPYEKLGETYDAVTEWLRLRGGTPSDDPWEIYRDPPTGDPAGWRTEVIQPYEQRT
jgi:effector-binding domain-containing protein